MTTTQKTWIGQLIADIVNIFHKAETVVDDIFKMADDFVNQAKTLESSQIGQFLESGIESLFPASTAIINAVKIWFPQAAAKLAGVQGTVASTEGKVQAFIDHITSLKESDPTLYAGTLNTLNADLQQLIAGVKDVTTLTPQMSIAGAQVAHDPALATG